MFAEYALPHAFILGLSRLPRLTKIDAFQSQRDYIGWVCLKYAANSVDYF